jgi:hypothetical protein
MLARGWRLTGRGWTHSHPMPADVLADLIDQDTHR